MWTKKYITSVAMITMVIIAIGGILWNKDMGSLTLESFGSEWYRGPDDAAITIDVFPNFTCTICVEVENLVVKALDLYPGKLRIVYHHHATPGFAQKVAEALEAAGEQSKFWELHDRLIKDRPRNIFELRACAEDVGLDMQKFNEALESGKFAEKVKLATEKANEEGIVYGTVFINGVKYREYPYLDNLCQAIDEELERLGTNVSD